jgi:hypothetical protein
VAPASHILDILETTVLLAAIHVVTQGGNPLRLEVRLKRDVCGFKSCPQDRSAATVVAIELLAKGFAGARNTLHLEFPWSVAELPAAS